MKGTFKLLGLMMLFIGLSQQSHAQRIRAAFLGASSTADSTHNPPFRSLVTFGSAQVAADTNRIVDSIVVQSGAFIAYDYAQDLDSSIGKLPIGKFTDLSIRQGRATTFFFYSSVYTDNVNLSYKFSRPINSQFIQFNSSINFQDTTIGKFSFIIPDTVTNVFYLTLKGERRVGNQIVVDSQMIKITPEISPKPESIAFGVPNSQNYPDMLSRDYFMITDDTIGTQRRFFNGRRVRPRIVEIAGIQLTIDENMATTDDGNIFARFHSPDSLLNSNIEQISIYADKLYIKSHIYLPATHVRIFAREVYFIDQAGRRPAAINTSAVNNLTLPGVVIDGEQGGAIEFYVNNLYLSNGKRLIANGGKGSNGIGGSEPQPATKGGDGGRIESNYNMLPYVRNVGGINGVQASSDSTPPARGKMGVVVTNNRDMAWMHANYFNLVQKFIDDIYFLNFRDSAYNLATRFAGYINTAYAKNLISQNPDTLDQIDLSATMQGFNATATQIRSGLDIMGNPNGWVPMLSFAASSRAFENQITALFETIYLSQFVKNANQSYQAKFSAINNAVSSINRQIQADTGAMGDLVRTLPLMEQKLQNNKTKLDSLQKKAEDVEANLKSRAQKSVESAAKAAKWGSILKGAGMIASLIPVPGASWVGSGISAVGNAFGENGFPTGDNGGFWKWGLSSFGPLVEGYAGSMENVPESMAEYRELYSKWHKGELCPDTSKNCSLVKQDSINRVFNPLSKALLAFTDFSEKKQVKGDEVEQKLSQLEAQDPEFKALTQETSNLQSETAELNDQIKSDNKQVQDLGNNLNKQFNAVGVLSQARSIALGRIDMRMVQYLDQMEAINTRRLKHYLYLMAKSWEYTTCSPYPGDLNLTNVFSRLRSMLDTAGNGLIPANQLNSLKAIFKQEIYDTRDEIISQFSSQGPGSIATTTFELLPEQIAELQSTELGNPTFTFLNIVRDSDFLPDNRENLRIKKIWIDTLWVAPKVAGHRFADNVRFSVSVMYPNSGKIKKDGQIYSFLFGNGNNNFTINWDADLNARTGALTQNQWDADDICQSLMNGSFLQSCDASKIVTRPALDAKLKIQLTRSGLIFDTVPHVVKKLRIGVEYYYRPRTNNRVFLAVQSINSKQQIPFFVSTPDINGRQHGYGPMARTFNPLATSQVRVTAPYKFGKNRFVRWEGSGTGSPTNLVRNVPINSNSDSRVFARYEPLIQNLVIPDTVYVPEFAVGNFYLPFRASGNDTLEYVIDSVRVFEPGFALPQAKKGYLPVGRTDSVLFTIPPTPTVPLNIIGEIYSFAPESEQFTHKTVIAHKGLGTGIPVAIKGTLSAVPNPNNGHFHITLPTSATIMSVQMIDMSGKVIQGVNTEVDGNKAYVDASTAKLGVYIVQVIGSDQRQYTARIIKL